MSRTLSIAVAALASALVVAVVAQAAPVPKTVLGTVGPGFTINLTLGGQKVTRLKQGVRIASSSTIAPRSTTST